MADVLLFHHALGPTEGLHAFANELRQAGHTVHTPDLFEGRTFDSIEAGVGYANEVGWDEIMARGERAAESLPNELVYGGFSLGVVPAQKLAQTRPGAHGALFFYSCVPLIGVRRVAGRPPCADPRDGRRSDLHGGRRCRCRPRARRVGRRR